MSDYVTFAAESFGPVLAKVAQEEGESALTPALKRRAAKAWNLSAAALEAVFERAEGILATKRSG